MHSRGLLHRRDVKAENILMGLDHNENKISNTSKNFCIISRHISARSLKICDIFIFIFVIFLFHLQKNNVTLLNVYIFIRKQEMEIDCSNGNYVGLYFF